MRRWLVPARAYIETTTAPGAAGVLSLKGTQSNDASRVSTTLARSAEKHAAVVRSARSAPRERTAAAPCARAIVNRRLIDRFQLYPENA